MKSASVWDNRGAELCKGKKYHIICLFWSKSAPCSLGANPAFSSSCTPLLFHSGFYQHHLFSSHIFQTSAGNSCDAVNMIPMAWSLSSTFSPGDFILLVVSSFLQRNEMLPSLPSPAPLSFCSIICTAKPKTALVEKWAESPNVAESRTWSSKPRAIVSPARPCRGFCHCRGHREIPDGAQSCCLLLFDLYQFQITQYSSRMLVCSLASGLFKRGYLGGN